MNWGRVEFDWNQARAFAVTAAEGSLTAAARQLKQTQPTLSRQIAALEKQLGVTLFERVGKRLELTHTARGLLPHVQAMAEAANRVALNASGSVEAIQGEVRISAGEALCAYVLPRIVAPIRERYPELRLHLVAANQQSDLQRREADIAVRHVRPAQSELVAKRVRDSSAHLYAAKSWLERHGRPVSPSDLASASFVGADDNVRFLELLHRAGLGIALEQFGWLTQSHVVGWEMVREGLGVGAMIREVADLTLEVEQVLPEVLLVPVPFWLCAHRELHTSQRIRVVYDALAEALAPGRRLS